EPPPAMPTITRTSGPAWLVAFGNPARIARLSPTRSGIARSTLLEAAAGLHRQPGVAGEVRVGLRPLTQREGGAARVVDQALMTAAVTEPGVGTGHRSDGSAGSSPTAGCSARARSSAIASASIEARAASSGPKIARF